MKVILKRVRELDTKVDMQVRKPATAYLYTDSGSAEDWVVAMKVLVDFDEKPADVLVVNVELEVSG